MTQYAIDFLETNKHYRTLFQQGGGIRNFNHGPYQQIMNTEFRKDYPLVMSGDANAVVKLVLAVYDHYDAWKESGAPVSGVAPFEMKLPELRFPD